MSPSYFLVAAGREERHLLPGRDPRHSHKGAGRGKHSRLFQWASRPRPSASDPFLIAILNAILSTLSRCVATSSRCCLAGSLEDPALGLLSGESVSDIFLC